jgi:hypothetical protein
MIRAHSVGAAEPPRFCEPAGTRTVAVDFAAPAKIALAGLKIRLDYPTGVVSIPGFMDDNDVKGRVRNLPAGALGVPNDEDGDLIVGLVSTTAIPPGRLLTVEFDRCGGARAPAAKQFRCQVQEASTEQAKLVDGVICAVTFLEDRGGSR